MLKTAIYMRVSTQDQSVESQRHELKRFVEARDDLELVSEYEDVISGVTERRAQLDALMLAARQRKIEAVVFFDFTRLTRKGIQHALELLRQWREANVRPICYSFPMLDFSDDSGTGEVIAALLAWMGQQERQMLQRRIKAGMEKAKTFGTKSGNPIGRPRLGAEQQSRIRSLRRDGKSYGSISKELNLSKSVVYRYAVSPADSE
jgi:DNA invertase Pin-like site-specific DNA recombinase